MATKKPAIKKTGSYKGRPNKLGGGGQFAQLQDKVAAGYEKKGMSEKKAKAIGAKTAAKIGRKALGPAKMAKLAVAGKKAAKK